MEKKPTVKSVTADTRLEGLDFGRCIVDILEGKITKEQVVRIIAEPRLAESLRYDPSTSDEQFQASMEGWADTLLSGEPSLKEQFMQLAWKFRREGKLEHHNHRHPGATGRNHGRWRLPSDQFMLAGPVTTSPS